MLPRSSNTMMRVGPALSQEEWKRDDDDDEQEERETLEASCCELTGATAQES